ncbi:hypothetical protein E1176_09855, partial [Fulvivirga sp. RKSG066]|uniref:Brp/Blh family beta-carotene 15,15'-dioxygenase n=1 Tax=Fulvivirga aurantia TaxID=2529383 RepID=UPI0012BC5536
MALGRIDRVLIACTLAVVLLSVMWPAVSNISTIAFLGMLVVVGIPHGAIDHLIHFKNAKGSTRKKWYFYIQYLGLAGLVAVSWLYLPILSFLLFMLISAYHFGQSQLFYLQLGALLKHTLFLVWGIFLLSIIVVFNYNECYQIFSSLSSLLVGDWMTIDIWQISMLLSGGALFTIFNYLVLNGQMSFKRFLLEFSLFGAFVVLSIYADAILSFTIYFGLWHSLRSLFIEYKSLKQQKSFYSAIQFIRDFLPYTLIAIIFL